MERLQADRKRVFDASPSKSPDKTPSKHGAGAGAHQLPTPLLTSPLAQRAPGSGLGYAGARGASGMAIGGRTPMAPPPSVNARHGRPMLINVLEDDPVFPPSPVRPSHASVRLPPLPSSKGKGRAPRAPAFAERAGAGAGAGASTSTSTSAGAGAGAGAGAARRGPASGAVADEPIDWDEPVPHASGPQLSSEERERLIKDLFASQAEAGPAGVDLDAAENQRDALVRRAHVDGLTCALMPHQVLGVDWMRAREAGTHKAGILADDMGLGKTVQMLALVVSNRRSAPDCTVRLRPQPAGTKLAKHAEASQPQQVDPATLPRPTLVVAPLAVVRQWADEFSSKTNCGIKVLVHHGKTKATSAAQLAQHDVVVTTYDTCKTELAAYLVARNTPADQIDRDPPTHGRGTKKSGRPRVPVNRDSEDDSSSSSAEDSEDSDDDGPSGARRATHGQVRGRGRRRGRGGGAPSSGARRVRVAPHPLFELDWLRVVLDEAQNVKNYRTKGSEAVCILGQRAETRWCLSGTPIQNNVMELYALIKFMRIPPFDDMKLFKEKIATPLASTSQARVNWGLRRLRTLQGPLLLRRTKESELDGKKLIQLPQRHVHLLSFDFGDPAERAFYAGLEEQMRKVIDSGAEAQEEKIGHIQALVMLLRLRQACNHPALTMLKKDIDSEAVAPPPPPPPAGQMQAQADDETDLLAAALERLSVNKRCDLCNVQLAPDFDGLRCATCAAQVDAANAKRAWQAPLTLSSKISKMLETLANIRNGQPVALSGGSSAPPAAAPAPASASESSPREDVAAARAGAGASAGPGEKTIIFSQFTSFLNLVEPFLQQEGYKYVRYDGSMPPAAREEALRAIRCDPAVTVILISFRSGSTGLNLTCCNHVILMDLWWNPQLEEQAFDRAHRLGQKRPVHVYKLAITQSVEQRLLEVQDKKRQLANSALAGEKLKRGESRAKLSWQELMYLFNVDAQ